MEKIKINNLENANQDFTIEIIDFYKGVDKKIINNMINDNETKDILNISSKNDLNILKKDKNNWVMKDKRIILKEIDVVKKKKVKEITSNFNNITKPNQTINILKDTNNKLISEIESIDNFKKNIENEDIYNKLKNLASLTYTPQPKKGKKSIGKMKGGYNIINDNTFIVKIVDLKDKISHSDSSSDFLEIFSNNFK
jgi:hypothetical protein